MHPMFVALAGSYLGAYGINAAINNPPVGSMCGPFGRVRLKRRALPPGLDTALLDALFNHTRSCGRGPNHLVNPYCGCHCNGPLLPINRQAAGP
jgi:hypothetical protein